MNVILFLLHLTRFYVFSFFKNVTNFSEPYHKNIMKSVLPCDTPMRWINVVWYTEYMIISVFRAWLIKTVHVTRELNKNIVCYARDQIIWQNIYIILKYIYIIAERCLMTMYLNALQRFFVCVLEPSSQYVENPYCPYMLSPWLKINQWVCPVVCILVWSARVCVFNFKGICE